MKVFHLLISKYKMPLSKNKMVECILDLITHQFYMKSFLWVLLGHFPSLTSWPNHESIHWSLDMVHCLGPRPGTHFCQKKSFFCRLKSRYLDLFKHQLSFLIMKFPFFGCLSCTTISFHFLLNFYSWILGINRS